MAVRQLHKEGQVSCTCVRTVLCHSSSTAAPCHIVSHTIRSWVLRNTPKNGWCMRLLATLHLSLFTMACLLHPLSATPSIAGGWKHWHPLRNRIGQTKAFLHERYSLSPVVAAGWDLSLECWPLGLPCSPHWVGNCLWPHSWDTLL